MIQILTRDDLLKCVRNELVPENLTTCFGIEGLLQYRIMDKKRHVDSIYEGYDKSNRKYYGKSMTAECFEIIYGSNSLNEGSSDTIFNCWSFLNRFIRGKVGRRWVSEIEALNNLNSIFEGYEELKSLLDKLANYQHCLANFMPAPIGFNGSKTHDGKGAFDRDNDMPDLYYQRALKDFPKMFLWINQNLEQYCLDFFTEFNSNLIDRYANKPVNVDSNDEINQFEGSIKSAINCIEKRANSLSQRMKRRS